MKIVLLGHTGFIGKTVFKELKAQKISVHGISSKEIDLVKSQSSKKLERFLKRDMALIITTAITREKGDDLQTFNDNIKIIVNVAHALENNSVKKCVYLSTADVYGHSDRLPITEQTPIKPLTYYAMAKYICEKILQITCQKNNIPLIILRYNGVFGPGQRNIGYGPNYFISEIKKNGLVKIWGNGQELRDTVYVKDLAKIIIELSFNKATGVYNIATGKSYSFTNILKMINLLSAKNFRIVKRKRTSHPFDQIFDNSKLKKIFTKITFTPIEKALWETYNLNHG